MCDQTEIDYLDGEVVWVKLGSCWWPGEVVAPEKLPPDLLPSFRKPPIAVVKFFQEDTYEYVKNINSIYKYDCSRKSEFINKGLYMYRTKHGLMEKFPEDVIRAETAVGGDIEILTRDEFQETKKESYAGLFGDSGKRTPGSIKKGKGRGKSLDSIHPRNATPRKQNKDKTDYKVHILLQGSKPSSTEAVAMEIPSTDESANTTEAASEETVLVEEKFEVEKCNDEEYTPIVEKSAIVEKSPIVEKPPIAEKSPSVEKQAPTFSTPTQSGSGIYACHACAFSTTRLNVLILHNKTHSVSFTPYIPSPVRKKAVTKSPTKSTPISSKTPKVRRPRKEKSEKSDKSEKTPKIIEKVQAKKRTAEERTVIAEPKKAKTDEEIKSSLLADWDDDVDDESNGETSPVMAMSQSPEVPVAAESPAEPTPAELSIAQIPSESPVTDKKDRSPISEKPELTSDSKYEFCEDEDWPLEADVGRKIPRVKNAKRKDETKSISLDLDEDEVAREVAELLNKTTVPDLPSAPEPLKVEENFPEPSIVKSPDKTNNKSSEPTSEKIDVIQPTKAIFKTKTFFRSRHSRSQDAIGKYVAEQLNAVDRMDISESDLNGSEVASSPEARDSPPIEHVKVARLAPKIQLKKMKAEAAQMRDKERYVYEQSSETYTSNQNSEFSYFKTKAETMPIEKENIGSPPFKPSQDVLYPTQEIKPLNIDMSDKVKNFKYQMESYEGGKNIDRFIKKTNEKIVQDIDQALSINMDQSHVREPESNSIETSNFEPEYKMEHEDDLAPTGVSPAPTVRENQVKETQNLEQDDDKELHNIMENATSVPDSELDKENLTIQQQNVESNEPDIEFKKESKTELIDEGTINTVHTITFPETNIRKSFEPYMNESTASAVDALLSVSREADRVTRVISDDPPEDLFEDDNGSVSNMNGELNENLNDELDRDNSTTSQEESHRLELETSANMDTETEIPADDIAKTVVEENIVMENVEPNNIEEIVDSDIEKNIEPGNTVKSMEPNSIIENVKQNTIKKSDEHNIIMESVEQNVIMGSVEQSNIIESILPEVDQQDQQSIASEMSIDNQDIILEHPAESEISSTSEISSPSEMTVSSADAIPVAITEEHELNTLIPACVPESKPSESDLQIAEALINLPSTPIQSMPCNEYLENQAITLNSADEINLPPTANLPVEENSYPKTSEIEKISPESLLICNNDINLRFETEQEKSENLNAAQSLVQMSESIDHKINIVDTINKKDLLNTSTFNVKQKNGVDIVNVAEETNPLVLSESEGLSRISKQNVSPSSRLLKILEEPSQPKIIPNKAKTSKHLIISGKEKILNFDVAKSTFKNKGHSPKQKIIIRRAAPTKNIMNNISEASTPEKIILSRSGNTKHDGSSVQTFTIQTSPEAPSDASTILLQQKIRKVSKPPAARIPTKLKPQNSLVSSIKETKTINELSADDAVFDINSMPIVLSEDLLTPENIDKMPIVMSDAKFIAHQQNPPKLLKTKQPIRVENEKMAISSTPNKPEVKTLLMNPVTDPNKGSTPNILSKTKIRGGKPVLVIDKNTGKQKIVMTKADPIIKEVKQAPTLMPSMSSGSQGAKGEKYIILPSPSSPRPARTQKIVIDPQTGKAHVYVAKGTDSPISANDNKPVSAKLMPTTSDSGAPGNTVMIITNAQGAQSRIVLTPEHEKILFPNKQQPNVSQIKTVAQRLNTNTGAVQKNIINKVVATKSQIPSNKTQTRLVPKQNSAIITSKGQLIVGGRVASTAQNIAPMPEIRTVPKRILASGTKKLVQTIQKQAPEPLIFLQQKSGSMMQLTAAQFEHLQRTGQIIQKPASAIVQEKIALQKSLITPNEAGVSTVQKPRARKPAVESPMPLKKAKHEIAIAPAPAPSLIPQMPALTPISNPPLSSFLPAISNTSLVPTTSGDLGSLEDLLPSTIVPKQIEPVVTLAHTEPAFASAPATLADGQLLAVPGEHFGGPPNCFYLCVEENGTLTPIDNRPLTLENNQLVPMDEPVLTPQPERRDILEAALANSDVFHADTPSNEAPDFRDLNANVSVHCRVSETSSTLNQPIMTPVEMPTKGDSEPAVPSNLEDGLAVIGVTPHTVPTSLELPITVTDPRIAPKMTDPLSNNNYGAPLLPSPSTDLSFVSDEPDAPPSGPISMPLLTDEESVGKSMPILTDDGGASPAGSAASEADDAWPRRLLTPASDFSDASSEIPLQPPIQLSTNDLSPHG